MHIAFFDPNYSMLDMWRNEFRKSYPNVVFEMFPNCNPYKTDYTLVWDPPVYMHNNMPNLRAIFVMGAGVDSLFKIKNLPNVPIVRLIDPTLKENMFKYVEKAVDRYIEYLPDRPPIIGVLGMGQIGGYILKRFWEKGHTVIGYRRTLVPRGSPNEIPVPTYVGSEDFAKFCAITDIMINALPLTKETIGIFNRDTFNMVRMGGLFFINIGRGEHVINKDLIAAFDSFKVQQATLDVVDKNPPEDYEELLKYRMKLHLTDHVAGRYDYKSMVKEFIRQVSAIESGDEPENIAYPTRGY